MSSTNITPSKAIQQSNGQSGSSINKNKNCCAKVMVFFRPSMSYKGEFGFDWVRGDDTDSIVSTSEDKFATASGTTAIIDKDIVGKYPNQFGNVYPGTFTKDENDYTKLCKTFKQKQHNTQSSGTPLYNTPVMSIYPKQAVDLELKMHIIKPAKGMHISYDSELFQLTPANNLQAVKGLSKQTMTIKCLKEFDDDQYIKIVAGGRFAGQLKILANSKNHMYSIKIALVAVETNFTSNPSKSKIGYHTGINDLLTKYLNQAYINPSFDAITLDVSTDVKFTKRNAMGGYLIRTGALMQADLDKRLYLKYDKLNKDYRDYYKVYFINEQNSHKNLYGQAADINAKSVFISSLGLSDSTSAHELFHAMGLYHTFDKNSEFVFKQNETDNIMDYSDVGPKKIQVNRSSHWQWKILHKSSTQIEESVYEKLMRWMS